MQAFNNTYFCFNWFSFFLLFQKCDTCLRYVETVLCTISLACGLGNVYRLPQVVLAQGGLPFFVAYIILTLFIGLPLLILEIGLGQIVQEGFMKTWRAVPFFRGEWALADGNHVTLRWTSAYLRDYAKLSYEIIKYRRINPDESSNIIFSNNTNTI